MGMHKYIKREWRNGRWRYYYSETPPKKGRLQVVPNSNYRIVSQDENGMRLTSRHNSRWLSRFHSKARSSSEDGAWNLEENHWDSFDSDGRKRKRRGR